MTQLRFLVAVATTLALAATSGTARADNPPTAPAPGYPGAGGPVNPGYPGYPGKPGYYKTPDGHGLPPTLGHAILENCQPTGAGQRLALFFQNFHHQRLPAFQAAPWYNYWPYDGHFLMPAPIGGQFYGPPLTGNFPMNPYFPGAGGATGYGPMPGGPPPSGASMVQQTGR
jgi:hypothetical protein